MVQVWFPGYGGHSWTSEDGKEYHWAWKTPSSCPRAGGSPLSLLLCLHHSPASLCRSVFFVYLWLFWDPPLPPHNTCAGFCHGCGLTPASESLAFRLLPLHHLSAQQLTVSILNSQERICPAHFGSHVYPGPISCGQRWSVEQAEIGTQVCLPVFPPIFLQRCCTWGLHGVSWTPGEKLLGWGEAKASPCCCCDGSQECVDRQEAPGYG